MVIRNPIFKVCIIALTSALTVAACGGGTGTSITNVATSTVPPNAGMLYAGPIQGFGSIIVNGMRFSSVGASLLDDDGANVNMRDLKLGMTVRVSGTADDTTSLGTATKLELVHGTSGVVTAIDITAKTITLLNQTIKTDTSTIFQSVANLNALKVGQSVEIYGAQQADGSVLATLVEVKTISVNSVYGVVSNLNSNNFQIGSLIVNYTPNMVTGALANGARIKVKAASGALKGNVLTANSIQVLGTGFALGVIPPAGTILKIKGVTSTAPVNGIITLSGTPVDVSKAILEGGSSIAAGNFLEVKGTWDGTTLQATKIEFEGAREARIGGRNELYGSVSSITGTVAVVDGVNVDLSSAVFSYGSASQVVTGTYIEVQGNVVGNILIAKKVELKSSSSIGGVAFEKNGIVSDFISLSNFKLDGLTVNAAKATFEGKGGSASLVNGSYIEIKGQLDANGVFIASMVELK